MRALEHLGIDVAESDPLVMASRWEDVVRGDDHAKKALVHKMIGGKEYKAVVQFVDAVARDAEAVVKNRNVRKYMAGVLAHASITHIPDVLIKASLATYREVLGAFALKRLRDRGINTKKKSVDDNGF